MNQNVGNELRNHYRFLQSRLAQGKKFTTYNKNPRTHNHFGKNREWPMSTDIQSDGNEKLDFIINQR